MTAPARKIVNAIPVETEWNGSRWVRLCEIRLECGHKALRRGTVSRFIKRKYAGNRVRCEDCKEKERLT